MTLVIPTFVMIGVKPSRFAFKVIDLKKFRAHVQGGVVAPWRRVAFGEQVCFGILMRL